MAAQDQMDIRSWKKVLLQWVIECNFAKRNYFTIEQSDVDLFYRKFVKQHTVADEPTLAKFLQAHYPEFEPHLDDENALSPTDYIYVYSLLLHFSCVRFPEAYFHETCQKLSSVSQQCIAAFCKEVLDCESLNKQHLRGAIANIAAVTGQVLSPTAGDSSGSSANTSSTSGAGPNISKSFSAVTMSMMRLDGALSTSTSPMKTPTRKVVTAHNISPSTPKTFLLEERTRELYNLRAQLETERYDKGLLEVQIKQNEEKIRKLNHDHKKLQQHIQELKNDILKGSSVNDETCVERDEQQVKRRMYKEVSAKEQEIMQLSDQLSMLREEKQLVDEKLAYAQKQILFCMERIQALDYRVDELTAELEQKDEAIRCLQESKGDLEHFIAEMRSASASATSRHDFNSSSDCLDTSFSRVHSSNSTANNSGSPENLGCSVVDLHLREQQQENAQLRKEISQLRENERRLMEHMQQYTAKLSTEYELEAKVAELDTDNSALACFTTYASYADELGKCYKNERNALQQLQQRIFSFEYEVETLKRNAVDMSARNQELNGALVEMQDKLVLCEREMEILGEQRNALGEQLNTLTAEFATERVTMKTQWQSELAVAHHESEILKKRLEDQQATVVAFGSKLEQQQTALREHQADSTVMKERHEKFLVHYEDMKRRRRETDEYLETMRNLLAVKELEISRIGGEINAVRSLNDELEHRINALINKCSLDKQISEATIIDRDERIKAIDAEREAVESKFVKTQADLKQCRYELNAVQQCVEMIYESLQKEHSEPLDLKCCLAEITLKLRELVDQQTVTKSKIKSLELSNIETGTRLQEVEKQLVESRALNDDYKAQVNDLKMQKEQQNVLQQQLQADEREMARLGESYVGQLLCLQQHIDAFVTAVSQLSEEKPHTSLETLSELTGHQSALHPPAGQKDSQISLQGFDSELLVLESGQKLQRVLRELQDARAIQLRSVAEIDVLQQQKAEQATMIGELKEALCATDADKEILLSSMQTMEDQLAAAEDAKAKRVKLVDNYKADLAEKQLQWQQVCDELRGERESWCQQREALNAQLAEQLTSITAISVSLSNHFSLDELEAEVSDVYYNNPQKDNQRMPLFEVETVTKSRQIGEEVADDKLEPMASLRHTLNRVATYVEWLDSQRVLLADQLDEAGRQNRLEITELREKLASNQQLANEVQLLKKDIQNLESVNERLSGENAAQLGNTENMKLRLVSLEQELCDLDAQLSIQTEANKEQQVNIQQLQAVNGEIAEQQERTKAALQKQTLETKELERQLAAVQTDNKQLNEKYHLELIAHEKLEMELMETQKALLKEEASNAEQRAQLEAKREQLVVSEAAIQMLQRDAENAQTDIERRVAELTALRAVRLEQANALIELKSELQRANDNVSQLIQQISGVRLEKEAVTEERQLLRRQLAEADEMRSHSDSKNKSLVERSQALERDMLVAENELKSLRAAVAKHLEAVEKLTAENVRLRDGQDASAKRIEKLALKLGDTQARADKCERDNMKLMQTAEANATSVVALQRDKHALHERLAKAETCAMRVSVLEQINAELEASRQELEASALDVKTKLSKLEKSRDCSEERIRKTQNLLNQAEADRVRLTLEIGALNSQLQELGDWRQSHLAKVEVTATEISAANELSVRLAEEALQLRDQNAAAAQQLTTISESLQQTQQRCERLDAEMQALNGELLVLRAEKSHAESEQQAIAAKFALIEKANVELKEVQAENAACQDTLIAELQAQVNSRQAEVHELQAEVASLRAQLAPKERKDSSTAVDEGVISTTTTTMTATEDDGKMESLRNRLKEIAELLSNEKALSDKLRMDNQILQVKYRDAKERLAVVEHDSEKRIKEHRLELEGKLDKMKNKMKTLYNDEVTKMKKKQDSETVPLKTELDLIKAQNVKYEEHTKKLSAQIVRLNEQILERQKQNALLNTRLKHMEERPPVGGANTGSFKRPSTAAASFNNLVAGGTNLTMEDEEGEVFNNTYLTDLKFGRMSELMSRDVCAEELQYRNSLLPPHLKSAYVAQYDHGLGEDELRDGGLLDDSMSALLTNSNNNTTTSSSRNKKLAGGTHYKRPGPPTPSKNGGRLSFGGCTDPPREILKETYDGENPIGGAVSSSAKTPARFAFFTTRFSLGGGTSGATAYVKDEPQRKGEVADDLRRLLQRKQLQFAHLADVGRLRGIGAAAGRDSNVICTSTPRKSRTHFDQRRLLDQLLSSSPSPSPCSDTAPAVLELSVVVTPAVFVDSSQGTPICCTPLHHRRHSRRSSLLLERRQSANASTPTTTSSPGVALPPLQRRLRRRRKRDRGMRPSLNLHGNIFAKHRTPTQKDGAQRDLNRNNTRRKRMDLFNELRMLQSQASSTTTKKNYASFSHNASKKNNATIVICKQERVERELPEADDYSQETEEEDDVYFIEGEEDHIFSVDDEDSEEEDLFEMGSSTSTAELQDEPVLEMSRVVAAKAPAKSEPEVVSEQQLIAYDKQLATSATIMKATTKINNTYGDGPHFERLLAETASAAPFIVQPIDYTAPFVSVNNNNNSKHITITNNYNLSTNSDGRPSSLSDGGFLLTAAAAYSTAIAPYGGELNVSPPTTNTSTQLCRTIYGGSIIFNRRLPHVNTTSASVRKSSIYFKNRGEQEHDVILVADQTITIMDLLRMWRQMSGGARLLVILLAVLTLGSCVLLALVLWRS